MKTVQNGQCRENKDLVRRVTKATEAISAALTHDAGAFQAVARVVALFFFGTRANHSGCFDACAWL